MYVNNSKDGATGKFRVSVNRKGAGNKEEWRVMGIWILLKFG